MYFTKSSNCQLMNRSNGIFVERVVLKRSLQAVKCVFEEPCAQFTWNWVKICPLMNGTFMETLESTDTIVYLPSKKLCQFSSRVVFLYNPLHASCCLNCSLAASSVISTKTSCLTMATIAATVGKECQSFGSTHFGAASASIFFLASCFVCFVHYYYCRPVIIEDVQVTMSEESVKELRQLIFGNPGGHHRRISLVNTNSVELVAVELPPQDKTQSVI
ncbi:uncharacterized protein LOC131944896 isoform X2 [Physella acuta]|nr:uncharacterized protein LOC131944896 isoform X2 [Physella acuta]XP_059161757.1 uncharacterized protein LOC131944896 isoform X2 [Physella acuta]